MDDPRIDRRIRRGLMRFRLVPRRLDLALEELAALRADVERLRLALEPRPDDPLSTVDVLGHRMLLDPIDTLELREHGIYEPFETKMASSLIRPGQTAVDVGANIGYYTLLYSRLVGPAGRVVAFEPDPDNFALLRWNVRLNGCSNVELHHAAVSDASDTIRLYRSADNFGDHRIYDSGDGRSSTPVDTVRLDDVLTGSPVHVVKVDVQGAEGAVLRGMQAVISSNPSLHMISEVWPVGLRRAGTDPRSYLRSLVSSGFDLFLLDEDTSTISAVDPDAYDVDALEASVPPVKDYTNVLCVPRGMGPPAT